MEYWKLKLRSAKNVVLSDHLFSKKQKRKSSKPACLLDFLAESEGFEPSWDCSQTDFEDSRGKIFDP